MAALDEQDFVSVADEKFDFDISLSPASSKGEEDEDEVFVGPIQHKERCIAVGVEAQLKDSISSGPSVGEESSWSPLTVDNFDEISKEAQLVVSHLDSSLHGSSRSQEARLEEEAEFTPARERFAAESAAKRRLSPIKRETFCIQDSPLKQLPPAIQQRLMKVKGSGAGAGAATGPGKPRLSTSSPIRQPGVAALPRMALRSKTGLAGPRSVLPSRPTVPAATQTPVKMRPAPPDKHKLQPPARGNLGPRRSLSCRASTRMGSTEDLLSDSASVTSDVSDTSLNTSLTGKRSICPPCKPALRRPSSVRAPVAQTQRAVDRRRNTSSSSSSVSSINSSTTASPMPKGSITASPMPRGSITASPMPKGSITASPMIRGSITASPMPKVKLNSSLNSSGLCVPAVPAAATTTAAKSRRSSVMSRAPELPAAGRRSISVQSRKPSEPLTRPVKSTPCKKPDPTPVPTPRQTPARRSIAPASSVSRAECAVKGSSRLTGLISATPTNPSKGPNRSEVPAFASPDGPRIMKPKRLMSACSMENLALKPGHPAGLQTPSADRDKLLPPSKMRRLSALPTPSGRRVSAAPIQTPKSAAQPRFLQRTESLHAPSRKALLKSPSQAEEIPLGPQEAMKAESSDDPAGVDRPELGGSLIISLETDAESQTAPPSDPAPEVPEPVNEPVSKPVEPLLVNIEPQSVPEEEKTNDQTQLDVTQGQKMTEVLLMDLPAPTLTPDEKLLIDLSNTPDLIRTTSIKATGHQLIDLSSPLIKWSPDDKKENVVNEAPLIDLSF
ncbi:G2 and S phase-expressed protein 1 isoform X1 [Alosa sapidissima]|uniref:G2 and S phase-expressed protein 1 isoform X1 n=1 Tax=Alosa sapidissima TaxID=34773 RepID=UPI001C0A21EE|nr:G2 and S phase-expressed protein 1 isoform X1 [Alosa sapidissima]